MAHRQVLRLLRQAQQPGQEPLRDREESALIIWKVNRLGWLFLCASASPSINSGATQQPLSNRPFGRYFDLLSNHSGTVWGRVVGI